MKLFQKLLLAPAALGMFAPIAATASEANFGDVTSYSQNQADVSLDTFKAPSNKNPLLAGGEGTSSQSSNSDFDVDTFSSTTTASFNTTWAFGAVDGPAGTTQDKLGFAFEYGMELETSFTGNDSLLVELEAGPSQIFPEMDFADTNNAGKGAELMVGSISYTTNLGDKASFFFGSGETPASLLYNTACVYGAQTDTLSDCGVALANIDEGFGTTFGASFDLSNGFTASLGYEGENKNTKGLGTNEGTDAFGAQIAYNSDNYGLSVSWATIEKHAEDTNVLHSSQAAITSIGINAYYSPDIENLPSVSVGIENQHDDDASLTDANDEKSHYFIGLQWDEIGNGTLGAAYGSKSPYTENTDALTMYEVFYAYNYADGITITPLIYNKENSGTAVDEKGILLKTTFEF